MTAVRDETTPGPAVGQSWPRLDSREKVLGATRYAADVPVAGLLHARLVLSVYAHARINRIDTSTALELVTFQSDDHKEALAAIRDKRPPQFKGR